MEQLPVRDARVGDFRRKIVLGKAGWPLQLNSFAYDEVPGLGSGLVPLESPVVLLTGPNGVGKSTLAKCIFLALNPASNDWVADPRMGGGSLKIEGQRSGERFEISRSLANRDPEQEIDVGPLSDLEVGYLDSARKVATLQGVFGEFDDIDELTNGVAPIEISNADLAAISRIVCRDYRSVKAYEVDVSGVCPFFEVSYGPTSYSSTTMGDGELAALIIWWTFWRAKEGSIIVLEEPEAYLSAVCQKNLCEYILSVVVKKQLICIASSHSPNLMGAMPPESIRFFSRADTGVHVVEGEPPPVLLKSIGVVLPKRGHLFVEDTAGKAFVRSILEKFNPSLSRSVGITVSGGEGEIRTDLERFAGLELDLLGLGVFDGDIDSTTLDAKSVQLPGNEPVEAMFRRCANERIERLADISGVGGIDVILRSLEGKDHHDWLEDFARELGLDKGQAFNLLFRLWIEVKENSEEASMTAAKIAALLP